MLILSGCCPRCLQGPGLVVAEILSVDPHPKADRLRVVTLDAGGSGTVKVVTNAPNVEEGMKVVLAVSSGGPLSPQFDWGDGGASFAAVQCGWVEGNMKGSAMSTRKVWR